MKTSRNLSSLGLPETYEGLCRLYLPRPIHDQVALNNATEMTDALAGRKLNKEQEDYLDLLSDLIADYEEEYDPIKGRKMSGLEFLKYLLEQSGGNAAELSRILGSERSLGAKILRGERWLTADHITTLSRHFAVRPDPFLS